MFHIHILPSHYQGPQGSFLSSDLLVLQSPTSPLGLPGAAPVRTSNPAWHRIIRPASLGFPAAVLAPPSWPGPGEAGQLQESSEAIWSFVRWRQEGTYQRSKSVLLSTQEKEEANFYLISTSSHPRDIKAASLAQTSWSCRVPPAPWASLVLPQFKPQTPFGIGLPGQPAMAFLLLS